MRVPAWHLAPPYTWQCGFTATISNILNVGASWKFTYSPDGSKIAISLPTGIATYNADGSLLEENVLIYPFVNTASEYAWVASPVLVRGFHTAHGGCSSPGSLDGTGW